eukprot:1107692-Rhodomonas_salina.1
MHSPCEGRASPSGCAGYQMRGYLEGVARPEVGHECDCRATSVISERGECVAWRMRSTIPCKSKAAHTVRTTNVDKPIHTEIQSSWQQPRCQDWTARPPRWASRTFSNISAKRLCFFSQPLKPISSVSEAFRAFFVDTCC